MEIVGVMLDLKRLILLMGGMVALGACAYGAGYAVGNQDGKYKGEILAYADCQARLANIFFGKREEEASEEQKFAA